MPSDGLYSKHLSAVSISNDTLVVSLDEGFPVQRVLGPNVGFEYEDWAVSDPYGENQLCYEGVARHLLARIEDLLKRRGIIN
jgi:protein-tyrosine-phosphatase